MEARFETFTMQIAKISRCIKKIKTEEMSTFNLKSPHVSCLYYMFKQNKPITAKELCDLCDEDKGAISRSIDYLEKDEYIFADSKTEKRYKSPLSLTEKGLIVGQGIADKVDNILDIASEGLSDEKRKIFYESLMLISDNLQKICDNYGE